ncbi:uncharacterized protein LTHEOB_5527 [Lasiodiplodia theobromae]|uniref:uncharacterized protein n=1 Tax=Lasiodiplodia theobromae TaxID=45133 RepID=UPI0015C35964|nr:uncharacterized protein LTHEOB_5527 [Lasiodiplodia theobromae]KAF4545116.1 hypothetical protein LTHEOB_5527 [Lasiodiplodia theobromae]
MQLPRRKPSLRTTPKPPRTLLSPISPISPKTIKPLRHASFAAATTSASPPPPTTAKPPTNTTTIICNLRGQPLPPRLGKHPAVTARLSSAGEYHISVPLRAKSAYLRWRVAQWKRQRRAHAERGDPPAYAQRLLELIALDEAAVARAEEALGRGEEVEVVRERWRERWGRERGRLQQQQQTKGREDGVVDDEVERLRERAEYLAGSMEGYLQRLAETEEPRMRMVFSDLWEQDRQRREEVSRKIEEGDVGQGEQVEKVQAQRSVREDRMRSLRPRKGGKVVKRENKRAAHRV